MDNSTLNFTTPEAFTVSLSLTSNHASLIIFVCSINVLLGLPTHSYVMWLIVTGSKIASRFFNLNFSVCEIGNCLNILLSLLSFLFSSLTIVTNFLQGLVITGRPLFQCLICVERYLAVIHPVTFLKFRPLRYRVICCTAAWIISLGSCVCCMFTLVSYNLNIFTWFFSIQFLLFLCIQLFFLLAVLRALKQSGPGERGREKEEENHTKRRAFHLILITTVNMLIMYVPYTITGFLTVTQKNKYYIQVLWTVSLVCFILAGLVHPVFYLHRAGKFCCICSP